MSQVMASIQVVIRCDVPTCQEALLVGMSPEYVEQYFDATDPEEPNTYLELARHTSWYNRAGWTAREELDLDYCVHHPDRAAKVPEVYLEPSR